MYLTRIIGAGGTKFCAQSISKEGKCECGVSTSSSKSDQSDKQKYVF